MHSDQRFSLYPQPLSSMVREGWCSGCKMCMQQSIETITQGKKDEFKKASKKFMQKRKKKIPRLQFQKAFFLVYLKSALCSHSFCKLSLLISSSIMQSQHIVPICKDNKLVNAFIFFGKIAKMCHIKQRTFEMLPKQKYLCQQ